MHHHNILNLIAAIIISISIILGWQHFYERPRLNELAQKQKEYQKQVNQVLASRTAPVSNNTSTTTTNNANRVYIKSPAINGSINLQGMRIDDITLLKYKDNLNDNSSKVQLLSQAGTQNAYFIEMGWTSRDKELNLPNSNSIWQADSNELTPENPVHFSWHNNSGLYFTITISMDNDYLLTVQQGIINNSSQQITVQQYGLINRNYHATEKAVNILHQGPIAVIDDQLQECSYDNIKEKKIQKFTGVVNWAGITDKYWLVAFIPDQTNKYNANFSYALRHNTAKFQVDFITNSQIVQPGQNLKTAHKVFVGAKKVDLLDKYEQQHSIKLFDRAIDFGWFYILTKPVFNALNFFYHYVGNFGVSILIVTIIIKILMFSLANKSYRSMKKIKKLQPEIERIKKLHENNKMALNQEIMALYKREKVNPLSGCLPLFIQIPVFFSIYKVLYVTIEMRQAPFFGWIKDLSAPDPTTIFNLFGLIPFTPPSFLMIGAWPLLMAGTMFLQQRMSPEPADPTQAQVMRFMPLIFLVMFSGFPAGLLIYWSWNNVLSIIQQYYINKLDKNNN